MQSAHCVRGPPWAAASVTQSGFSSEGTGSFATETSRVQELRRGSGTQTSYERKPGPKEGDPVCLAMTKNVMRILLVLSAPLAVMAFAPAAGCHLFPVRCGGRASCRLPLALRAEESAAFKRTDRMRDAKKSEMDGIATETLKREYSSEVGLVPGGPVIYAASLPQPGKQP